MLTPYNASMGRRTGVRGRSGRGIASVGFVAVVALVCVLVVTYWTVRESAYTAGYRQAVQDSYAAGYYGQGADDALLRF